MIRDLANKQRTSEQVPGYILLVLGEALLLTSDVRQITKIPVSFHGLYNSVEEKLHSFLTN